MAGPISVHEYELAEGVTAEQFREALREADNRDLFDLEGLSDHRSIYGIRGDREGQFAALWFWKSQEEWESLWGPVDDPVPPESYPEAWKIWENEILDPLLPGDPDKIRYTSYRTVDI